MSTHMAYGFVSAYGLALLFAVVVAPSSYPLVMSTTAWLVLAGLVGGIVPDVDSLESMGFVHKKTCHYIFGYLLATVLLVAIAALAPQYQVPIIALACITLAAWLHSIMDLADGFRDNDPSQGIYEHIVWRRWLPSRVWIPFAGTWEWVLQAFAALLFIPISANLSQLVMVIAVPNWKVGTIAYGVIWVMSVLYDVLRQIPKRQAREFAKARTFRGIR